MHTPEKKDAGGIVFTEQSDGISGRLQKLCKWRHDVMMMMITSLNGFGISAARGATICADSVVRPNHYQTILQTLI